MATKKAKEKESSVINSEETVETVDETPLEGRLLGYFERHEFETARNEVESMRKTMNNMRLSFVNTIFARDRQYGAETWILKSVIEKKEEIQRLSNIAERSDGIGSMHFYRTVARLKVEIDFLLTFFSNIQSEGFERSYKSAKSRYDSYRSYRLEKREYRSAEQQDEDTRREIEENLLDSIKFYCECHRDIGKKMLKEKMKELSKDDKEIIEYIEKYIW